MKKHSPREVSKHQRDSNERKWLPQISLQWLSQASRRAEPNKSQSSDLWPLHKQEFTWKGTSPPKGSLGHEHWISGFRDVSGGARRFCDEVFARISGRAMPRRIGWLKWFRRLQEGQMGRTMNWDKRLRLKDFLFKWSAEINKKIEKWTTCENFNKLI